MLQDHPDHPESDVDIDFLQSSAGAELEFEDPVMTDGLLVRENQAGEATSKQLRDLLSEAFDALSAEEREKTIRKVYGIADGGSESQSSAFVDEKLQEMERELNRLRTSSSWSLVMAAIELAETQSPAYVQHPKFRLRFLQAEEWDATKAAARFIRHFDLKMDLFGTDCLGRDVTIQDLSKEEQKIVKKGFLQILPVRDRTGRSIAVTILNGQTYPSLESMCRVNYVTTSAMDGEERGVVSLVFKMADVQFKKKPSSDSYVEVCSKMSRIGSDLPWRYDVFHTFLEGDEQTDLNRVDRDLSLMSAEVMARSKAHYGTYDDWMEQVTAHGIPRDFIPFKADKTFKTKSHIESIEMRKKLEVMARASSALTLEDVPAVLLPARRDVLFGKGKPFQFFSGNQHLAFIIDGYLDQYHNRSSKQEKTALAEKIVAVAKSEGARFLSKESGVWQEVTDHLARGKVSQMLRHKQSNLQSPLTSDLQSSRRLVPPTTISGLDDIDIQIMEDMHPAKRVKLSEDWEPQVSLFDRPFV